MNRNAKTRADPNRQLPRLPAEGQVVDHSLFRTIPAMLHSIDASGVIVDVSQRWLEILGYSRSEVIGRKSVEFLTEESKAYAIENVLPEFFRTGRCVDIPYQFIAKDGRIVDVLLSATCERDAAGQVLRSMAVMQDITARKRAERQLDVAKHHAENLLRKARVMVVELDSNGRLKRVNEAVERLTGYSSAELHAGDWFEMLAPAARYPGWRAGFEQSLAAASGGEFEMPVLTRDGDERQILWHNSPVVADGALLGTLSVGVDVTQQKAMEKQLAESERTLREAQSVARIGSWLLDYEHGELHWSAEIYRILAIDPHQHAPSKEVFLELLHPEDLDEVKRAYKMALRTRRPYEIRHRLRLADGSLKYVYQRAEIAFAADGSPLRAVGTLQDVTMAVLQELAFQESEERFRTIVDFTYDWEYWQGNDQEILYISPSCQRITGYSQFDFIREPALLVDIIHPDDKDRLNRHLAEVAASPGEHQVDFRIVTKDNRVRWIAHGCRAVVKDGRPKGRRVSNRDITDLKEAEQLAQKLAYFDVLTGLPNRRMLTDRLGQALAAARREQRSLALMYVDLDRFKFINDRFGHDVGDRLLVEVAARIADCVRAGDTVARTGGDEFIVLLPEIKQPGNAGRIAEKILATLEPPVECDGHVFEVSASIGVGLFDAQGDHDGTELMKQADIAMYAAKQAGRNCYRVFDDSLD